MLGSGAHLQSLGLEQPMTSAPHSPMPPTSGQTNCGALKASIRLSELWTPTPLGSLISVSLPKSPPLSGLVGNIASGRGCSPVRGRGLFPLQDRFRACGWILS